MRRKEQRSLTYFERVTICPDELRLELRKQALLPQGLLSKNTIDEDEIIKLAFPLQMKRRGFETKLIIGGEVMGQPDPELIKLIAKSRDWYEGLKTGRLESIGQIGTTEKMDSDDVSRMLPLAFLAPSIINEIIAGNHPIDLTPRDLMRKAAKLPLNWEDQRSFLGMKA